MSFHSCQNEYTRNVHLGATHLNVQQRAKTSSREHDFKLLLDVEDCAKGFD